MDDNADVSRLEEAVQAQISESYAARGRKLQVRVP